MMEVLTNRKTIVDKFFHIDERFELPIIVTYITLMRLASNTITFEKLPNMENGGYKESEHEEEEFKEELIDKHDIHDDENGFLF